MDRAKGPPRHFPPTSGFWKVPGGRNSDCRRGSRRGRGAGRRVQVPSSRGLRPPSPGAALAAHGARGAVTLLHDHADVGFHELGHVHHLRGEQSRPTVTKRPQGQGARANGQGGQAGPSCPQKPVACPCESTMRAVDSAKSSTAFALVLWWGEGTPGLSPCATWRLPDAQLSHFAGKIKPPSNHISPGMIRAGMTVPTENHKDWISSCLSAPPDIAGETD